MLFDIENGATVLGQNVSDFFVGNFCGNLNGQIGVSKDDNCGGTFGGEFSCAEMEVDSSSISSSMYGLLSVNRIVPDNIFPGEEERVLIDTGPDITKNLPATNDQFSNLTCKDVLDNYQQVGMDVELPSTNIPPTLDSLL